MFGDSVPCYGGGFSSQDAPDADLPELSGYFCGFGLTGFNSTSNGHSKMGATADADESSVDATVSVLRGSNPILFVNVGGIGKCGAFYHPDGRITFSRSYSDCTLTLD